MSDHITVLHVDDDPKAVELGKALLEAKRPSIEVVTETSTATALERLDEADCVLCDYTMPEMDGLEFLEAVRDRRPGLPFILITGRGSEEIASQAISAGVSDYVRKAELSRNYDVLGNRIENLVAQYRSARRATHQERLNTVIRDVNRALVRSSTREAIEREACRALTGTSLYDAAWIGRLADGDDDAIAASAVTPETATPTAFGSEPVGEALRSGGVAVRSADPDESVTLRTDGALDAGRPAATWREVATGLGCRSVAAVPIEYADERYGAVVVLSRRPDSFDGAERDVLAELADDVAHAIHAAETRERLRRREKHLSHAQSVAKLGSWYKDIGDDTITWSEEVYHIFDRSEAEGPLDHEEFLTYVHPDDREFVDRRWEAAKAGEEYDIEHRIVAGGETKWVREKADLEFDEDGTPLRGIGVVQDVTDRKEHERRLRALNEAMSRLHRAGSREVVGRTVAHSLAETLEDVTVGVHLLDSETGVLEPVASPSADGRAIEDARTIGPDDGPIWEAFVAGERRTCRGADCGATPGSEPPHPCTFVVPIADAGVIVVGADEAGEVTETGAGVVGADADVAGAEAVGPVDAQTAELVDVVSSAAREAIARIDRERHLDESEAELREQAVELDRLKRVTRQSRRVLRAIVNAEDRAAVESTVCERLAETDGYAFVWLGHVDPSTDRLVPAATAGDGRGYLAEIDRSIDDGASAPAVRTARSRERTAVENTAEGVGDEPWRREALARGFRSALSIPLQVDDVLHGVLTIYATDVGAFDDLTREVLVELGRTVAYGVSTATQRDALYGNRALELVLEIGDEDYPWRRVAREADCSLEIESTIPRENGTVAYLTVPAEDPEAARERLEAVPIVADVSTAGSDGALRVALTRPDGSGVFAEVGGVVTWCAVDDDGTTVRVELPRRHRRPLDGRADREPLRRDGTRLPVGHGVRVRRRVARPGTPRNPHPAPARRAVDRLPRGLFRLAAGDDDRSPRRRLRRGLPDVLATPPDRPAETPVERLR